MRKKDKLYTVNKFNKPAFMDEENLFWPGGQAQIGSIYSTPNEFFGTAQLSQSALDAANKNANYGNMLTAIGAKGTSLNSTGSFGAGSVGGDLLNMGAGLVGGLANNVISGGLNSGAGSAVSSLGSTVGGIVRKANPFLGAAITVGSNIFGGGINALFGESVDEEALKAANEGTVQLNNFTSNAGSFDEVKGPEAVANVKDVYKGGLFNDVSGKNEELKEQRRQARSWADRSIGNNVHNLIASQTGDLLSNYSAFGGPLESYDMDGAIGYGFMSDYLNTKRKKVEDNNRQANIFAGMPNSMFDLGGDIQTHGSDWSDGLITIGAGGSHEENPNDGVQMGVDNEGTPNLVEEGETVYDDYVFSNRILADDATKQMFRLPKKKDITFADISKRLEKEIEERPNDPISRAGFEAQMQKLTEQQERQKQEMEAQRAKAAFEALSPEEQTAVMQQVAQQTQAQQVAQAEAMQQSSPEKAAMMQQQQMMQADGSQANLGVEPQQFAEGGKKNTKKNAGTWKSGNSSTNWAAYTKNGLRDYLLAINDELENAESEEKKKEIRERAIKTVNSIQKAYSEAYQANLTPSERSEKVEALQKAFQEAGGNAYFSDISKNINMPKGHNTADTEEKGWVDGYWGPRTSIRNWGSTEYGDADYYQELADLAADAGLTYAPGEYKYGDNTLYQLGMAPSTVAEEDVLEDPYQEGWEERRDISTTPEVTTPTTPTTSEGELADKAPKQRAEWMRYAGLFGPAVGLGFQMAGVGKPDTSSIDAAMEGAGNAYTADYKPLGNYLTYRPMDIWYEQNRMDANARATDRAIMNNAAPIGTKMAGLLASGYNSQIADGELYRKALEYNDAKRKDVAEFNRGTDQFNAEAYNRLSQFNTDARNRANQFRGQLAIQAAREKMDADAGWYNSLYGNISGLFKGLSDLGRENAQYNMIAKQAADGVWGNTGDSYVGSIYTKDKKKAKGGKMKRKGGLTL